MDEEEEEEEEAVLMSAGVIIVVGAGRGKIAGVYGCSTSIRRRNKKWWSLCLI